MKLKELIKSNFTIYSILMKAIENRNKIKWEIASKYNKKEKLIARDYKKNTGQILRIPPISYTEKMQFSKIYQATPEKGILSDKYLVRKWVKKKIGEKYLIPIYGAWDKYSDINLNKLPNRFVLKTNHCSGTNVIIKDKKTINHKKLKKMFGLWMSQNWSFAGRGFEMHYQYIQPKIIAEKYIVDAKGELNDYKFLCFNGKPYYVWVDVGRHTDHRRNVYDLKWNLLPWRQYKYKNTDTPIKKPKNYNEMVKIAKILCKGFDHVRVDLYNVDGKIYFGEMTFTNGKGYELIYPSNANNELGKIWNLNYRNEAKK